MRQRHVHVLEMIIENATTILLHTLKPLDCLKPLNVLYLTLDLTAAMHYNTQTPEVAKFRGL